MTIKQMRDCRRMRVRDGFDLPGFQRGGEHCRLHFEVVFVPAPVRALVAEIKAFAARSDIAHLDDGDNALLRIADLACSRLAIDSGEGEVDLRSLAVLGGVSEGRVRNLLLETDGPLERDPDNGIKALSAAFWLQKKKGYLASVWQEEEPDFQETGKTADLVPEKMIFVPVARDGSMFTPDLQLNGSYRIGAKGAEENHEDFSMALSRLNVMAVLRWRRPNDNRIWGIVSGVAWQRIEKK
ncbi:hypothetical protein [Sulfitobacter sp.]|jgi:hypothetical protein|uniref:hypothetical protein n=1 Tax=Sulfitobacter sp. TaxID=1903071 RepID=UPI0026C9C447|tara:strand:+ start:37 stop:756 length:720 start_codon:yes stop_codon:yes gene_type:complete